MHDIQQMADSQGHQTVAFVGRRKPYDDLLCEKFGNGVSFWIHVVVNTLLDRQGHASWIQTRTLIKKLRKINPDIIHLHNLHGYYLHIPTLFHYLYYEYQGDLYWTFHDLWPITGHCAHYVIAKCDKWKEQCACCPNKGQYPISWLLDSSKKNYQEKKELFGRQKNLNILVPSRWMEEQVKQSFLKNKNVTVVANGIDLDVFTISRTASKDKEELFTKYGIAKDKKIVLGVANVWELRKGLSQFYKLESLLSEDYQIVLVGLTKLQKRNCPSSIIAILKTENKSELVKVYGRANVLLNCSQEESFSLVTIEAMACGTPVIGYENSAVSELINQNNGKIINTVEAEKIKEAIYEVCEKQWIPEEIRSSVAHFSNDDMGEKVMKLYMHENDQDISKQ